MKRRILPARFADPLLAYRRRAAGYHRRMRSEIDHLVLACADLDRGAAWVEALLGAAPAAGGRHPATGTHDRRLKLGPRCYLELLAIDPDAPAPDAPRWFGLDDPALQARLAQAPVLVGWVAATGDIHRAAAQLPMLGEPGRHARDALRWTLALPEDGRPQFGGVLPALIQWDGAHPCDALPDAGCALRSLDLAHPAAAGVLPLFRQLRLAGPVQLAAGPRSLRAQIGTPRGDVLLGE